jgi:hypothetical protein
MMGLGREARAAPVHRRPFEGRYHTPPRADVRKRIVALLAGQGWHVTGRRLVIGERTADTVGALTALGQDARIAALHADVRPPIPTLFVWLAIRGVTSRTEPR